MSSPLDLCRTIELPRIASPSGAITAVEGAAQIPFAIQRVFFLYDIIGGAERGGHAHRLLEQVYVVVIGGCRVILDDGRDRRSVELRSPHVGLYVPTMIWTELVDFASGTIAVVLASRHYEEAEYIRDYESYRRSVGAIS
jgi:WxcM-like protein